jgi:hypothetical protein
MDDLEEALENIDVFCRTLAEKLANKENGKIDDPPFEPIEHLLREKYFSAERTEPISLPRHFIPLPELEKPLIDVFEDENYVKVLMQCHCMNEEATVHPYPDSIEICKKVCRTNSEGVRTCKTECQKLAVPVEKLKTENMIAKCNNNQIFEVDIPKQKT